MAIHVRSGDVMSKRYDRAGEWSGSPPHAEYWQPPVAYYVHALSVAHQLDACHGRTHQPRVIVLCEDLASPVCEYFALAQHLPELNGSLTVELRSVEEALAILGCSRHVVKSMSTMYSVLDLQKGRTRVHHSFTRWAFYKSMFSPHEGTVSWCERCGEASIFHYSARLRDQAPWDLQQSRTSLEEQTGPIKTRPQGELLPYSQRERASDPASEASRDSSDSGRGRKRLTTNEKSSSDDDFISQLLPWTDIVTFSGTACECRCE